MTVRIRLSALALLLALASSLFAAAEPWDGAPLTADPKALLAAAEAVPAGESGAVILLDEATHTFDEKGGSVSTQRIVYRIANDSAIDNWGSVNASWAPWVQERPEIQARVVTKDGTVHVLDAHALIEAPAPEESLDIFSDNRVIRAPLPAVAVGSVVEQLITYKSKESLYDLASSDVFFFGGYQPVHRARLVVDAPLSLALQFVNQAKIDPRKEEKDGRQHIVYEGGPYAPKENFEWDLPFDVSPLPWVGVSIAKSWQDLAKRYAEIVEKQIANASLEKEAREAWGTGNRACQDRQDCLSSTVTKALAWIQTRVRYAGVEVGESSVVPRPPQTVLSNRYGDCKDKATLLVALLREAKIRAHVALLRAGEDFDVPHDLPGLGMFNHAIVVVEGPEPLWVDPTDEYSRAGELPLMDQGRFALIASADTTSLATTPVYESTANRSLETRVFTIPEEGKASVVETTEPSGADESSMRRFYVSTDRRKYRESMEEYAKNYYSAKALSKMDVSDPHDLTSPFRIRIEAAEASRGLAMDGEAAVAIFPAGLLQSLPWSLRNFIDEKDDDATKAKKTRRSDFVWRRPFVREWRYQIVPPSGFEPRTLPKNETVKLGTTTLSKEFTTDARGSVFATFRFDTGKRRLAPSEVEETKKAFKDFIETKAVMIGFDQRGQLELANGNISAALVEFRKLASAHPKEGRHQVEIAKALLAGGMGDAAREQIKKAIALEPSYARAHRMHGIILQHDLFGRPFRRGFDLPGAVAAYRKAKELDPKDQSIRGELAKLLEYGEEGLLFGRSANVNDAIAEFRALIAMDEKQYEPELYVALARAKRFDELREAVKTASDPVQQNLWRVVAAGATDGAKAAIREAGAGDQAQRKEILRNAGSMLLALRMYGTAADLIEEATQGSPSSEARQQVENLRKARPYEEVAMPKDDPKSVVKKLMLAGLIAELTSERVAELYAADEASYFKAEAQESEWHMTRVVMLNAARQQGLPMEFYADLGLASMQLVQDGDDATGYRIRIRSSAVGKGGREETIFVVREGDEYRVSATRKSPALIGLSVLRLLDAGKPEIARQWLNWTREEFPAAGGDDPLETTPFSKYWAKSKPSATVDEMRVAAAMLMPSKEFGERALPILNAAREKAATDEERLRIDHSIAILLAVREDYAGVLPVVERLSTAAPDSAVAFNMHVAALARLDRADAITKLASARLERFPKDDDAIRALGGAAMNRGDYASCDKFYRQVIEELRPSASDYNNIAWNALLSGVNLDRALAEARQAMQLPGAGPALLHTLASLYAETGKSLEAREALLQSMDDAGRDEPADHDWYVFGRIAENYGATDAALAAYRRVEKPATDVASSTYVLAARRIKDLGVRQR